MVKEFESNGVKVEIPDELESVVALEYSFVEALAKLELNVTGIADDKDKNNLENSIKHLVGNYTSVGSRLEPDTELIKKAEPQLILADKTRHESIFEKLNTAAPTVLLESFDANYDQSIETFKQIAELVSKEDKGRELVVQHNEKVEDLSKDIKLDKDVSTIGQFLQKVGFNGSIPEDMENHLPEYMGADYLKVDTDRFASFNPERILIMVDEDNKADYEKLKESEAWANIEAVRNDRVHDVNRERWAKYRGLIASELILEDLTNIEE